MKLAKELNPEANRIYHFSQERLAQPEKCLFLLPTTRSGSLVPGMFWGFGCVRLFFFLTEVASLSRIRTAHRKESIWGKGEEKRGEGLLNWIPETPLPFSPQGVCSFLVLKHHFCSMACYDRGLAEISVLEVQCIDLVQIREKTHRRLIYGAVTCCLPTVLFFSFALNEKICNTSIRERIK